MNFQCTNILLGFSDDGDEGFDDDFDKIADSSVSASPFSFFLHLLVWHSIYILARIS